MTNEEFQKLVLEKLDRLEKIEGDIADIKKWTAKVDANFAGIDQGLLEIKQEVKILTDREQDNKNGLIKLREQLRNIQ